MIRGYRTISFAAATALAHVPPLDLLAGARKLVYDQVIAAKADGLCLTLRAVDVLRKQTRKHMIAEWLSRLHDSRTPGRSTMEALIPQFERWMERPHGQLTFRVSQVLSGHGCFGEYLHRIGKVQTPNCEHCDAGVDTALHTLRDCEAWSDQRSILRTHIGDDLSLPGVTSAILDSDLPSRGRRLRSFVSRSCLQKRLLSDLVKLRNDDFLSDVCVLLRHNFIRVTTSGQYD